MDISLTQQARAESVSRVPTNCSSFVKVGCCQLGTGVNSSPAPEHDTLESSAAVQALLGLLVGLLVVGVLGLGTLCLINGQETACDMMADLAFPGEQSASDALEEQITIRNTSSS